MKSVAGRNVKVTYSLFSFDAPIAYRTCHAQGFRLTKENYASQNSAEILHV